MAKKITARDLITRGTIGADYQVISLIGGWITWSSQPALAHKANVFAEHFDLRLLVKTEARFSKEIETKLAGQICIAELRWRTHSSDRTLVALKGFGACVAFQSMSDELQHLSHSFRTDAELLLQKATFAFGHPTMRLRTSFQAKLVVDAYMSVECSLKSIMCSKDAQQKADVIYAQIRKIGHDLSKLLRQASTIQLCKDDRDFLRAASKRGIHLRYSLDLFNLTTCELLNRDPVTFTINQQYVKRFFDIADNLSKQAQDSHKNAFPFSPKLMTAAQLESYVRRLRKIEPKSK